MVDELRFDLPVLREGLSQRACVYLAPARSASRRDRREERRMSFWPASYRLVQKSSEFELGGPTGGVELVRGFRARWSRLWG